MTNKSGGPILLLLLLSHVLFASSGREAFSSTVVPTEIIVGLIWPGIFLFPPTPMRLNLCASARYTLRLPSLLTRRICRSNALNNGRGLIAPLRIAELLATRVPNAVKWWWTVVDQIQWVHRLQLKWHQWPQPCRLQFDSSFSWLQQCKVHLLERLTAQR